jgi:hypothetical protein
MKIESMRQYFKQLTYLLSVMLPIFNKIRFKFLNQPLKQFFIDEILTTISNQDATVNPSLNAYLMAKANEFGIRANGSCKYCNLMNVNMSSVSNEAKPTFVENIVNQNGSYRKIITNINLFDSLPTVYDDSTHSEGQNKRANSKFRLNLNEFLFNNVPNIRNLSISNIDIEEFHESVQTLKQLRNLELVDNSLTKLPNKITSLPMIQQIHIENNPITELPYDLFCNESLRSVVLSKLTLDSLPDDWFLDSEIEGVYLKCISITQTRIGNLPNDLLINCKHLEQLVYQGVHLILPESEQQWTQFYINLDTLVALYCPTLMSQNEAIQIFRKYDYDKNFVLNHLEIQHLNAYLFDHFERLGKCETTWFFGLPTFGK